MTKYIIEDGNFYRVAPSGAKRQGRLDRFIKENFAKELEGAIKAAIKADYKKASRLGDDLTFDVIELLGFDKRDKDILYFVCSIVFYQIELGRTNSKNWKEFFLDNSKVVV